MGSLNKVQLIGYVGRDPEIRRTQDGRPIANFSIATSESWRDKNSGERKEITDWHNIVCFNESLVTNVIEKYVEKGMQIYVEGQMKTRKWQDQNGVDRYSTEVVIQGFHGSITLLGGSRDGSGYRPGGDGAEDYGMDGGRAQGKSDGPSYASSTGRETRRGGIGDSMAKDLDDDIPF